MSKQVHVLIALLCAATMAWSQQIPPSPLVRAFGDNKFWIVVEEMVYVIGSTNERIVVPKGFVTDFASIPQALWALGLSPHGQYSRAAVIHDYLYWSQGCSRGQADRLLVIAMKESSVSGFDEFLVYRGVDMGGAGAMERECSGTESRTPTDCTRKLSSSRRPQHELARL